MLVLAMCYGPNYYWAQIQTAQELQTLEEYRKREINKNVKEGSCYSFCFSCLNVEYLLLMELQTHGIYYQENFASVAKIDSI